MTNILISLTLVRPGQRDRNLGTQKITWLVIKSTQHAVLLGTPGGEVWVPKAKLSGFIGGPFGHAIKLDRLDLAAADAGIDALMAKIAKATAGEQSCLVPVTKVAKGSSAKVARYEVEIEEDVGNGFNHVMSRSTARVTLPISQIKDVDGQLMAPQWLFKDKLASGQKLVVGDWPGLPAVRAQIESMIAAAINEAAAKAA